MIAAYLADFHQPYGQSRLPSGSIEHVNLCLPIDPPGQGDNQTWEDFSCDAFVYASANHFNNDRIDMCGRLTRMYTWQELVALYRLTMGAPPSNLQSRYNICPTTDVDVIISSEGTRTFASMRWGLIPGWWSKRLKDMRLATFNARAETITTRPVFRNSFKRRRCLMPASGYYEWHDRPSGKQPYYFTRRDGQVMTFAAIHDTWTDPATKMPLLSCSIVITEPNKFVAEMHDRMPVIFEVKDFEQWERGDAKDAVVLMRPAAEEVLQKWPVSLRANSSRASDDDPTLIERITEARIL
jgi:putative SOS response-associated peptidase YedK